MPALWRANIWPYLETAPRQDQREESTARGEGLDEMFHFRRQHALRQAVELRASALREASLYDPD